VATREDAHLVVSLEHLRVLCGVPEANAWFWSDEFPTEYAQFKERYPRGSEGVRLLETLTGFAETVAVLWKHRVLDEPLLFEWLTFHYTWARAEDVLRGLRSDAGQPDLWENFEALAQAQAAARANRTSATE
jgi:hypothetical protein